MSDRLEILYEGYTVGWAIPEGERFALEYDEGWQRLSFAFPLSRSLPLDERRWEPERAHSYFANLLPEGSSRDAVARRLGLSVDNDVALLAALGGDTAGAFEFVAEAGRRDRARIPITADWLHDWASGEPAVIDDEPVRLSLAGAQNKISVVEEAGGWAVPAAGEPSTHILKFDAERFKSLSVNEFLMLRLGHHLGLDVVAAELHRIDDQSFLAVRRYDRVSREDGIQRLHQEDFCQATGTSHNHKYEAEGGPSMREIAAVIRSTSTQPVLDLISLVRWAVYCALSGNSDAHAKNISLLYNERSVELAPIYDLVCTRAYPRVQKRLAISIGTQTDVDRIDAGSWQVFAANCGIGTRVVLREVERQLDEWEAAFEVACAELAMVEEAPDMVATIRREISKRARALRRGLGAS